MAEKSLRKILSERETFILKEPLVRKLSEGTRSGLHHQEVMVRSALDEVKFGLKTLRTEISMILSRSPVTADRVEIEDLLRKVDATSIELGKLEMALKELRDHVSRQIGW